MRYAWLIWSLISLGIWVLVWISSRDRELRWKMLVVSVWTSILGLSEPFFVPAYWNPPSLFSLAQTTGFDIESLIFTFSVGGIVSVIYERLFGASYDEVDSRARMSPHHRLHLLAVLSGPLLFLALFLFTTLNPIYSMAIALTGAGIFTWYCRPDLLTKMLVSGTIFGVVYFFLFLTLVIAYPDYVKVVWNLNAISGVLILGVPLEELLFAFTFGFYWSSIYEHLLWRKAVSAMSTARLPQARTHGG